MDIMVKELAPIVISSAVRGPQLARRRVLVQCDNLSLVTSVRNGYSKHPNVMHLLRSLWFFIALYNIDLDIQHIEGVNNSAADMLSRNNITEFFSLFPQVSRLPIPLPPPLLQLIGPKEPDWTSPSFGILFKSTLNKVQPPPPETHTLLAKIVS